MKIFFVLTLLSLSSMVYAGPIKGNSNIFEFSEMDLAYDSKSFDVLIETISTGGYLNKKSLEVGFLDSERMKRLLEIIDCAHTPKLKHFYFGICQPGTEEVISQAIKIGKFKNAKYFNYYTMGKGNSSVVMRSINKITMPKLKQLHLEVYNDIDAKVALSFLRLNRIRSLNDIYFSLNESISEKLKNDFRKFEFKQLVAPKVHLIWIGF